MSVSHGHVEVPPQSSQYVMEDVRRAREFYIYLQPDNLVQPHLRRRSSTFDLHHEHVPSLSAALAPFCQLTVLRCNVAKAMLNVMDRDVMYFLAESSRRKMTEDGEPMYDFVEDPIFLSCSSVPLKGRICEMTIREGQSTGSQDTPFYVIPDLTKSQFANMGIVTGPPFYRFYAGVPITTRNGVNIGSLAIMDDKARPNGLTMQEEEFLAQTSRQIMTYLETNRQAIEGRRSRRMAKGLEGFIAGKTTIEGEIDDIATSVRLSKGKPAYGVPLPTPMENERTETKSKHLRSVRRNMSIASVDSYVSTSDFSTENEDPKANVELEGDSRSHVMTFARAANLLRECMGDLGGDGSVCFQSLKPRFGGATGKPGSAKRTRTPTPDDLSGSESIKAAQHRRASVLPSKARVIALSTRANPLHPDPDASCDCPLLHEATLQELMTRYPMGHLWSLEDPMYSSSEEDILEGAARLASAPPARKKSRRKQFELNAIKAAFPAARQVLFAPLWDATIGSSAHGVFVSTALETRSFNATSELSFLNAFCSTLMAECSRLDTMMADKQKSDFVGTISHEMRSPLHGVLASVEFLAETDVNGFQRSLIDTIDSCGRTLLDTINHVLDFSKVNSFQKQWQASTKRSVGSARRNYYLNAENSSKSLSSGAPPLLQLFAVTDISAVLEEVVDGLVLGHTYNSGIDITDTSREARGRGVVSRPSFTGPLPPDPVDIILDIAQADWTFLTQPGAVRRIIMNITGNAIKYTSYGKITISMKLKETQEGSETIYTMVFGVADTGKGISPEFLATRLFVPFAQENALAPGTGLGMSIVRSIVLMLGGTIDVKSTVGKGTTVEVTLPLKRPLPGQQSSQTTPETGSTSASSNSFNTESIVLLRNQASDATVTFWARDLQSRNERTRMIQQYVQDWYHLHFVDSRLVESVSVVVVEEEDLEQLVARAVGTPGQRPAIVVLCSVSSRHSAAIIESLEQRVGSAIEFVAKPFGPYKLARSMRAALGKKKELNPKFPSVRSLGVIDEVATPHPSMTTPAGAEAVNNRLQEMDLNLPGENDVTKVVKATETFAASQTSHHAQMAIRNPKMLTDTPQAQTTEGGAFPFPIQADEPSRKRRESNRSLSNIGAAQNGRVNTNQDLAETSRGSTTDKPPHVNGRSHETINPNILLVDDNKINLKLLETFLKVKRKYTRITQAEDGQQAVDAFKAAIEPIDIIFMDISMPVLNGFEATRAIRDIEERDNVRPGAMVIALTGLASGRDQSEGFDSGCDIYMTKPVSFKEVGKLLDNWEEHQKIGLVAKDVKDSPLHDALHTAIDAPNMNGAGTQQQGP